MHTESHMPIFTDTASCVNAPTEDSEMKTSAVAHIRRHPRRMGRALIPLFYYRFVGVPSVHAHIWCVLCRECRCLHAVGLMELGCPPLVYSATLPQWVWPTGRLINTASVACLRQLTCRKPSRLSSLSLICSVLPERVRCAETCFRRSTSTHVLCLPRRCFL